MSEDRPTIDPARPEGSEFQSALAGRGRAARDIHEAPQAFTSVAE